MKAIVKNIELDGDHEDCFSRGMAKLIGREINVEPKIGDWFINADGSGVDYTFHRSWLIFPGDPPDSPVKRLTRFEILKQG